jgi:hypothetical protein
MMTRFLLENMLSVPATETLKDAKALGPEPFWPAHWWLPLLLLPDKLQIQEP